MNNACHAEDSNKKSALRPGKGEKCAQAQFRGTTLFRRCLATTAFLGAITPALYNGSSRRLLLTFPEMFHRRGSQGSFGDISILTRTTRQLSASEVCPTFLVL